MKIKLPVKNERMRTFPGRGTGAASSWTAAGSEAPRRFSNAPNVYSLRRPSVCAKAVSPLRSATAVQNGFRGFKGSGRTTSAFSLVEVLLVITILSLIVVALMSVFSGTQRAFRASVTQSDVLEGGRDAMQLITADLRQMAPSGGTNYGAVNFSVEGNFQYDSTYQPLVQTLPPGGSTRSNLLEAVFFLGRQNTTWIGTGYYVNYRTLNESAVPLYPLYRFSATTDVRNDPRQLYNNFYNTVRYDVVNNVWTNMSHVVDGVVHFVVRAYDANGLWITNDYSFGKTIPIAITNNGSFFPLPGGETGCYLYSNTIPASVEVEMGVLEDRAMQRAESLPTLTLRTNYLAGQAGAVHIFRQRVTIPNFDSTANQ